MGRFLHICVVFLAPPVVGYRDTQYKQIAALSVAGCVTNERGLVNSTMNIRAICMLQRQDREDAHMSVAHNSVSHMSSAIKLLKNSSKQSFLKPMMDLIGCPRRAPELTQAEKALREDLQPGYTITKFIAKGAFGGVYSAIRAEDDKPVAVKVIYASQSEKERMDNEVKNQVRVLNREGAKDDREGAKDYIVNIYDYLSRKRGNSYVIMELFENINDKKPDLWSIKEFISGDLAMMRRVMMDILNGLKYCHAAGVAHLDLKPENILVRAQVDGNKSVEYKAKLADFGLSEKFDPQKWLGDMGGRLGGYIKSAGSWWHYSQRLHVGRQGTPIYMAPEMVWLPQPEGFPPEPPDVWAAGTTLYRLMFNKLPFRRLEDGRVLPEKGEGVLSLPDPAVKELASQPGYADTVDLLKKMLEVDPRFRISAAHALEHAWIKR